MAKLILRCNYLKDAPPEQLKNYVRYIATRPGVVKVGCSTAKLPSTARQEKLIAQLLRDIPEAAEMLEYLDYRQHSTRENASEFITQALEQNLNLVEKRKNYVDYLGNRPGVEKVGIHGLWTDAGVPVVLSQVADEVAEHKGVIWTHVISLHREDAARLGYEDVSRWQALLRSQRAMLAEQMKIDSKNLRWYCAFHNESHHPHCHLFVYSADEKEGYLTKAGIEHLRSAFAHEIFRTDFEHIYEKQNTARDETKAAAQESLQELIQELRTGVCKNEAIEEQMTLLAKRLQNTGGKKVYGYLKADVKAIVDRVVDELAKDGRVTRTLDAWYRSRDEIILTYRKTAPEQEPLSNQKEFKRIKNMVIEEAVLLGETLRDGRFLWEEEETEPEPADLPLPDDPDETNVSPPDIPEEPSPPPPEPDDTLPDFIEDADYHADWTKRYKEARVSLFGTKDCDPDFSKALLLFQAEAGEGNALAMCDLGRMYADGLGTEPDPARSNQWYAQGLRALLSAEAKRPKPYLQYRIGKLYAAGLRTDQDHTAAADWFSRAVERNHKYAQYSLAGLYYRGQGVHQDYAESLRLYTASAEQDNAYASWELGKMLRDGVGAEASPEEAKPHFSDAYHGFLTMERESHDDKLQYRLGAMLYSGTGTEKDVEAAVGYFESAARLGNVNAQYMLAKLLLAGEYVDQDVPLAVELLRRSAEGGSDYAAYRLGRLYLAGDLVEKDVDAALSWLTQAAEAGNQFAQYTLGKLYAKGEELPRDMDRAFDLLNASAKQGNQFAQYFLGSLYLRGEVVPKDVKRAVELLELSAKQGNAYAQYLLGRVYLKGEELPQNIARGVELLTASAEQGHPYAQYALGKLYLTGEAVPKNVEAALRWLSAAADQGNQFAQYTLGKLYLTGEAVPKNVETALRWLNAAADQGNQFAQYTLGKRYLTGEAVPKNVETALRWLNAAADQGNQYAQYALGKLYLTGRDVPRDRELAWKHLSDSAAQGNIYAQFFLDHFDSYRDPSVLMAATRLLHHLAKLFQDEHRKAGAGIAPIDRKRLRKLREKKIAQGHAPDDHEQQQIL